MISYKVIDNWPFGHISLEVELERTEVDSPEFWCDLAGRIKAEVRELDDIRKEKQDGGQGDDRVVGGPGVGSAGGVGGEDCRRVGDT